MRKKMCVVTGSRAEYGLLHFLMKDLRRIPQVELQVIVTGMHLSPEFGYTVNEIISDGLPVNKKIEILLSSDSSVGISKAMGLAMISLGEAYEELHPDIIIVLGDRFETFCAAAAALVAGIPVAHLHGGEVTEGAFDESFRHAITKMSHLHFASAQIHARRIRQLGENPKCIFNVGAIGVDNLRRLRLLSRSSIEKIIDFRFRSFNIIVTFHPVTLERGAADKQFEQLLDVLESQDDAGILFTKPNADNDHHGIVQLIDRFVERNRDRCRAYTSLGHLRYLSVLQEVDVVVGNSSSGLIEAPSLGTATINIGNRQKGRLHGPSVVNCIPEKSAIADAFRIVRSEEFRRKFRGGVKNPYERKNTSSRIISVLTRIHPQKLLKKPFFDIN